MTHRERLIRFVVGEPRDESNQGAWHELANKRDGTAHLALHAAPNVEAEVDLLEGAMPGDGYAEEACVGEEKADEAHDSIASPRVQFGSRRHEGTKQRRLNGIVEHDEVPPFGRQECSRQRNARLK